MAWFERLGDELAQRMVAGGCPAALARGAGRRREWYRAYVRGWRKRKEIVGERFTCGVALNDGEVLVRFAADLFAVPLRAWWETPDLSEVTL